MAAVASPCGRFAFALSPDWGLWGLPWPNSICSQDRLALSVCSGCYIDLRERRDSIKTQGMVCGHHLQTWASSTIGLSV